MFLQRPLIRLGLPAMLLIASVLIGVPLVQAHGSMSNPISRVYNCYLEGPEHPISPACQAAVAVGGTQALYDWNGIRQGNANGNHQAIIPDGHLCSANNDEFKGMDLARADWLATTLPTSGSYTFSFKATAPHRGTFSLYVTKNGYNPLNLLKWSDLESTPFSVVTDPPLNNYVYQWTAQLPTGKSGRHLIYMIWQRSDSPEAFYSCSDVIFGNVTPTATSVTATFAPPSNTPSQPTSTSTRTPSPVGPTATPSRTPAQTATLLPSPTSSTNIPAWQPNTYYAVNAKVTYGSMVYYCIQAHTSQVGWEPPNVPALWGMVH